MNDSVRLTITPESLKVIRRGQAALKRLDSDRNWRDWLEVGDAIMECRRLAMQESGTNRPFGPRYKAAFSRLMQHYHFTEKLKHAPDRSNLVAIMENLPAVEAWREQLDPSDKRRWNHPTTVWREFKAAQRKSAEVETDKEGVWRKPTAKEQLAEARAEIHQMRKGGGLPWGPGDTPAEQAQSLMEHLSVAEAEELGLALIQLAKAIRDEGRSREEPAVDEAMKDDEDFAGD